MCEYCLYDELVVEVGVIIEVVEFYISLGFGKKWMVYLNGVNEESLIRDYL